MINGKDNEQQLLPESPQTRAIPKQNYFCRMFTNCFDGMRNRKHLHNEDQVNIVPRNIDFGTPVVNSPYVMPPVQRSNIFPLVFKKIYKQIAILIEMGDSYVIRKVRQRNETNMSNLVNRRTHNYDFDISNFNINQLFLCGKVHYALVLIRDHHFTVLKEHNKVKSKDELSNLHGIPQSILDHIAFNIASSEHRISVMKQLQAVCDFFESKPVSKNSQIDENKQEVNKPYKMNKQMGCFSCLLQLDDSSTCVFLAPSTNTSQTSQAFYIALKHELKMIFQEYSQVIMLTPRSVNIADICDCFADSLTDYSKQFHQIQLKIFTKLYQQRKVKKCSLLIEKYLFNSHLQYICFFFGDFGEVSQSCEEEQTFINSYLARCLTLGDNKIKIEDHLNCIHPNIFFELGNFKLLNIVFNFKENFKLKHIKINTQFELLQLFYEYLINHSYITSSLLNDLIHSNLSDKIIDSQLSDKIIDSKLSDNKMDSNYNEKSPVNYSLNKNNDENNHLNQHNEEENHPNQVNKDDNHPNVVNDEVNHPNQVNEEDNHQNQINEEDNHLNQDNDEDNNLNQENNLNLENHLNQDNDDCLSDQSRTDSDESNSQQSDEEDIFQRKETFPEFKNEQKQQETESQMESKVDFNQIDGFDFNSSDQNEVKTHLK